MHLKKIASLAFILAASMASAQVEQRSDSAADPSVAYWRQPRIELNAYAGKVQLALPETTPAAQRALTIENESIRATWKNSALTLVSKQTGKPFLTNATFNFPGAKVAAKSKSHPVFGSGNALEISYSDGTVDTVVLYPKVPFAVFGFTVRNSGKDAVVVRSVHPLHASVSIGKPVSELKTLGTAGLRDAGKDPGSYEWLAVADPSTRHSVIFGMLSHERSSAVFFSRVDGGQLQVGAQLDYGRLRIESGNTAELDSCMVGYFEDGRLGLEQWAEIVAKACSIKLPEPPIGYCTWYSKPNGGASDEVHLGEQAAFAQKHLAPYGFSLIQIDDGWQAGFKRSQPSSPKKDFTKHNPTGPYPGGMKAAVTKLEAQDMIPGIWFMPFAGTMQDPFFSKQDWFVKTPEGKPYDVPWGGTCLDMTHPGARDHLKDVASRICREWGFDYIKIDGLWTGTATKQLYVNSGFKEDMIGDAVFHNPNKSNIEAYRDGLKLLRESIEPKVFILGCNGPQNMRSYSGAFGLVDAMRVGPDNGAEWSRLLRGPEFGARHYFLNGRVWYNDPDPVYVRETMPLKHAQLICSWVALSDQLNLSSEWLPGLPPERLDILKRTMPYHHKTARPVDLFEENMPRIWLVSDEQHSIRRDVLGLYNWANKDESLRYSMGKLGLDSDKEYVAFDYWANRMVSPIKGELVLDVPAQSCIVLAVRARTTQPQLISTSRHVTQGMIDVLEEKWDAASSTLSGRSKVIGGDPYELRFVSTRPAESIEFSEATDAKNSTGTVRTEDSLSRAQVVPTRSGEITWKVRFK